MINTDLGEIIFLTRNNRLDLEFIQEAFDTEAEDNGWFRVNDRLYIIDKAIDQATAEEELQKRPPSSILDMDPPELGIEEPIRELYQMEDGTIARWIRHPNGIPETCRAHWRDHQILIEFENAELGCTAYHSIHRMAVLEGADSKPRYFAPGGLRWIDYPDKEAAISDALDMSLAVAMKIQVIGTPCAGSKVSIFGDYNKKPEVLRSIGAAMERLGINISAADLGLSTIDMEQHILPVAPTYTVPLGVYQGGTGAALITYHGVFEGLKGMSESLPGSPLIGDITVSMQGLGEVGFGLARLMLSEGTRLIISEVNQSTIKQFVTEFSEEIESKQVKLLTDPDSIYDCSADIFCPCALRDILDENNLSRLLKAGIKMIGGPANNLFPDQINGPWAYHEAGIFVVPYEGIGAGGTAGVAHSIMTGIYGECPFSAEEKVERIGNYVKKIIQLARTYNLPPQFLSDRILFRRVQRHTTVSRELAYEVIEKLAVAIAGEDKIREKTVVEEYTKVGFFYGDGRFPKGGWNKV
jgi:leucine dehydrogenase